MDIVLLGYGGAILVLGAILTVLVLLIQRPRQPLANKPLVQDGPSMQVILPVVGQPLIWVVNGRAYAQPEQITAPEEVAALTALLAQLRPVLAGTPLAATAALAPGSLTTNPPQVSPLAPETQLPVPNPALASPPLAADPPRPPVEPTPRLTYEEELARPLLERLRASFHSSPASAPIARRLDAAERVLPPSMPGIEDLNTLVQARLADLPDAPPAAIRTGPSGMIEIVVAGRLYERVEEVPDEAVRTAMRAAIRTWERQLG